MPTVARESLHLTITYERGDDGWIIARIRQVPAAVSQGRTKAEARANVVHALRELALSFIEEGDDGPDSETLEVTVG
jgi:predicted RNase H-like HicB family nuclease